MTKLWTLLNCEGKKKINVEGKKTIGGLGQNMVSMELMMTNGSCDSMTVEK